jgi:hypothetical protein
LSVLNLEVYVCTVSSIVAGNGNDPRK